MGLPNWQLLGAMRWIDPVGICWPPCLNNKVGSLYWCSTLRVLVLLNHIFFKPSINGSSKAYKQQRQCILRMFQFLLMWITPTFKVKEVQCNHLLQTGSWSSQGVVPYWELSVALLLAAQLFLYGYISHPKSPPVKMLLVSRILRAKSYLYNIYSNDEVLITSHQEVI